MTTATLPNARPKSAFEKYIPKAWPFEYSGTMHVDRIAGGVPTNSNVAEAWIKTKLGGNNDDLIRQQVAETMAERGISAEEAAKIVDEAKHLNGFKRNADGLYIEGRQLKAAIKEAASCAVAVGKLPSRGWGATNKGSKAFVAEHICVVEDILPLGVKAPTGISQRFVSTHNGTGIQYEEFCDGVDIDFTIITDHKFPDEQWAMLWLTGQEQGIGATRSQGYGRYTVTRWETKRSPSGE